MSLSVEVLIESGPDIRHVDDLAASPNINERRDAARPEMLIMHYTGLESVERSIDVLRDPACQVSCHYVINVDGRITQMVREADRAWHAGKSYWHGITDINSRSIGIEIQNPGHERGYPDFPEAQMQAVERLAADIIARNAIRPEMVLGHSDVAPQRKIDPGEKFDWPRLHRAGIGHWVAPRPLGATDNSAFAEQAAIACVSRVQLCEQLLTAYGYDVACNGVLDGETRRVISAFQRHFRPANVDGNPDASTIATLRDLLAGLDLACLGATPTV